MINLQNVEIEGQASHDIINCLRMLYSTLEGEVPLDRSFGLNPEVLDLTIPIAKGKLTIDLIEKTEKYEPRVKVVKVEFKEDLINGTLIPKVVIENAE